MDKVLREYYGQVISLRGTSVSIPAGDKRDLRMLTLACGNRLVPVDTTSCPNTNNAISPGSKVEVTGVCLINTANWNPHDPFPRINGFTLVPRSPADLRLLSSPSWWTAGRLLVLVAVLVLALVAIVVWNRTLHRLVDRRSRQLFKTEIAKAEADLRVNERTRLAVNLHDSISQTLTGVSFQIDAARKTLPAHAEKAAGFLAIAIRTLQSCREELRRCLWDLRSNTLEADDFTEAVKRTVRPGAGDAVVSVRFNVRRALLSDTTAHAVLNIVRELTVNAVRHGHARHVRVAGEQKGGTVRFSVSDDGCGFVPSTCPGPNEGHFGLQGIRERINRLGGKIEITSEMGRGTKVTVEIGK
jgi:signal transduction histidine kinase